MDLIKELKKEKQKTDIEQGSNIVNDVKLLLTGESQEDIRIMSNLSKVSNFSRIQKKIGNQITLEKLDKEYGEVFHINQIRDLCIKYRLRFLNTQLYTGNIDVVVVQKIRDFISKNPHISNNDYSLRENYFIMAPHNMFKLEEEIIIENLDPIIFYKIDDNHFCLIHKWGNDFSPLRLLTSWRHKNVYNYDNFKAVVMLCLFSLLYYIVIPFEYSNTVFEFTVLMILNVGIFFLSINIKNFDSDSNKFSENNWNNNKKVK